MAEADGVGIVAMHAGRMCRRCPLVACVKAKVRFRVARCKPGEMVQPLAAHRLGLKGRRCQRRGGAHLCRQAMAIPFGDKRGFFRLQQQQCERRERCEVGLLEKERTIIHAACPDEVRDHVTAAPKGGRRTAIQQAKRHSILIHRDPRATGVGIQGRDVTASFAARQTRGPCDTARAFFVPIAEQMIAARLANPTDGAHQAATSVREARYRSVDGAMPKAGSISTPCSRKVIAIKAK